MRWTIHLQKIPNKWETNSRNPIIIQYSLTQRIIVEGPRMMHSEWRWVQKRLYLIVKIEMYMLEPNQ